MTAISTYLWKSTSNCVTYSATDSVECLQGHTIKITAILRDVNGFHLKIDDSLITSLAITSSGDFTHQKSIPGNNIGEIIMFFTGSVSTKSQI